MTWVHSAVRDDDQRAAYAGLYDLAEWSDWLPFELARANAPREPGVYLLREPATGVIRYAGMAGERAGSGRPQGLHGRLSVYWTGRAPSAGSAKQLWTGHLRTRTGSPNSCTTCVYTARNARRTGPVTLSSASASRSAGQCPRTARTPSTWRTRPSPCCGYGDLRRIHRTHPRARRGLRRVGSLQRRGRGLLQAHRLRGHRHPVGDTVR
jgi:hypothetical protein